MRKQRIPARSWLQRPEFRKTPNELLEIKDMQTLKTKGLALLTMAALALSA